MARETRRPRRQESTEVAKADRNVDPLWQEYEETPSIPARQWCLGDLSSGGKYYYTFVFAFFACTRLMRRDHHGICSLMMHGRSHIHLTFLLPHCPPLKTAICTDMTRFSY